MPVIVHVSSESEYDLSGVELPGRSCEVLTRPGHEAQEHVIEIPFTFIDDTYRPFVLTYGAKVLFYTDAISAQVRCSGTASSSFVHFANYKGMKGG